MGFVVIIKVIQLCKFNNIVSKDKYTYYTQNIINNFKLNHYFIHSGICLFNCILLNNLYIYVNFIHSFFIIHL